MQIALREPDSVVADRPSRKIKRHIPAAGAIGIERYRIQRLIVRSHDTALPVILSATTLHPRRAAMAAARRIYNVGCATVGNFAQDGYGSFGLQPFAHAAKSAVGPQSQDDGGRSRVQNAQSITELGMSRPPGCHPESSTTLRATTGDERSRGSRLLKPRAVCEAFRRCCCGFSRRWT